MIRKEKARKVAESHKGLLNRESLTAEDGVKYFRDRWDPTSSKEPKVCSSGDVTYLFEQGEENMEIDKWIGKFSLHLKRLCGDGHVTTVRHEPGTKRKSVYGWDDPMKCWKNDAERRHAWTLLNKGPGTLGMPHKWLPTETYFHSMITWQQWCSLLQVI